MYVSVKVNMYTYMIPYVCVHAYMYACVCICMCVHKYLSQQNLQVDKRGYIDASMCRSIHMHV